MKKVLITIAIYIFTVFGIFACVSFLYGNIPTVLDGTEYLYKFNRAVYYFLDNLPSIIISGFIVGCSIEWKDGLNSIEKYSSAMLNRFKYVIFIALGIVCVLTMSQEVCMPIIDRNQIKAEQAPGDLNRSIQLAEKYLAEDDPELAFQYALYASSIAPKNENVIAVYKKTKDQMDILKDKQSFLQLKGSSEEPRLKTIENPIQDIDKGYSILELLEKSKVEAEQKNWVNAHYWAALAVKGCSENDTNRVEAINAANYAWNQLSNPYGIDNQAERELYARKRAGYTALNDGDNLKAYYIFKALEEDQELQGRDPDIERYLNIARERVLNSYFFIDETEDMQKLNRKQNTHFAINHSNGSRQIVHIKGILDSNQDGGVVRYLEGVTIVTFDRKGGLISSMSVPFAKMIGVSTSSFTDQVLYSLDMERDWKFVPMLILVSVDRRTEGVISKPDFKYNVTGLPKEIMENYNFSIPDENIGAEKKPVVAEFLESTSPSVMLLSMPYDDLSILNQMSEKPRNMSLFQIKKFIHKADYYGYSTSVYRHSLVARMTYPLLMLIFIIFAASSAWNYRVISQKELFRFSWLFVLPCLNFIIAIICESLMYVASIFSYAMVGMFGAYALLAVFIVYLILLFIVSIHFCSRCSR